MRRRKRNSHLLSFLFLLALFISAVGGPASSVKKSPPLKTPATASQIRKAAFAGDPLRNLTCEDLAVKHHNALETISRSVELCDESMFLSACPALNENAAACVQRGCGSNCSFGYGDCNPETFRSALYGGEEDPKVTEQCLKRWALN
jgi:hypothetical protein